MAPYWRKQGIAELKRKVGHVKAKELKVTVISAYPLSEEDAVGCTEFKNWMTQSGASVSHWIPKPLSNGDRPLMHIKAVMADYTFSRAFKLWTGLSPRACVRARAHPRQTQSIQAKPALY